jgi:molecular chaperone DnaK
MFLSGLLFALMIFGIDLGTTHSLIGIYDAGFPCLLAGEDGTRLLPSAVLLPDSQEGQPLIGTAALHALPVYPGRVVTSVKRLMGMRFSDVDKTRFAVNVVADNEGMAAIKIGGQLFSPVQISAMILRELRERAERHLGTIEARAVITVPAYFNDAQRAATAKAGELAGWKVERILNEPTAAALAYGIDRAHADATVAVFDLGGGTFDLSILRLSGGIFEVVSTHGDTNLGGDDLDAAIVAWICEQAEIERPSLLQSVLLKECAVAAKHKLTDLPEVEIAVPEPSTKPLLLLSRTEFENLARPVLQRIRNVCARALHDARIEPGKLDKVLLVGGSTRVPAVQQLAAEIFGMAPDTTQHPDEAIAIGATLQGAILAGELRNITLLDVTPLSLGIETYGGLMNVLIPRNTTIPCKAGEMFTNAAAGQTSMRVRVLQGERELAKDNWVLGEFEIPFAPAPRGQARVGVQFELDANGILKVLARDIATGVERVLEVRSALNVSERDVEKMVNDSIEHAFEDMEARVFTEACIKADELLAAVESARAQLGDEIAPDTLAKIETVCDEIRAAKAAGSAVRLKAAAEELDALTEPLANQILEKLLA